MLSIKDRIKPVRLFIILMVTPKDSIKGARKIRNKHSRSGIANIIHKITIGSLIIITGTQGISRRDRRTGKKINFF